MMIRYFDRTTRREDDPGVEEGIGLRDHDPKRKAMVEMLEFQKNYL